MKTIKMTSLRGDWGGDIPAKDGLDKLETDLQEMFGQGEIRVYVKWEATPDGWELRIFKEEE